MRAPISEPSKRSGLKNNFIKSKKDLTGFWAQIGHFGFPQWLAACMGHSCAIPHPQSRSCDSWNPVEGEIIFTAAGLSRAENRLKNQGLQ